MANTKNLKKIDLSHEEAVENGRKGGKATAKRKKAIKSMQEAAKALLNGTYTDDDGKELTGYELMMAKLFKIATDETKRDCLSAMRLIREIIGSMDTILSPAFKALPNFSLPNSTFDHKARLGSITPFEKLVVPDV